MYYFRGVVRRQKNPKKQKNNQPKKQNKRKQPPKTLNTYKWKLSYRLASKYTGTKWKKKKSQKPDLINIESYCLPFLSGFSHFLSSFLGRVQDYSKLLLSSLLPLASRDYRFTSAGLPSWFLSEAIL